jgi:hypothetical protein
MAARQIGRSEKPPLRLSGGATNDAIAKLVPVEKLDDDLEIRTAIMRVERLSRALDDRKLIVSKLEHGKGLVELARWQASRNGGAVKPLTGTLPPLSAAGVFFLGDGDRFGSLDGGKWIRLPDRKPGIQQAPPERDFVGGSAVAAAAGEKPD